MENNLFIKETYVNVTKGYNFGNSEWYETFTDETGRLFRSLQKEYGKAGKMYRDTANGGAKQVGWVFSKRMKYEDADEYYTREVWVEVSKTEPVKKTKTLNIDHPFK